MALHTYSLRDRQLEEALQATCALGFDTIELWIGHAAGDVRAVARTVASFGVEVAAVGAGGFYDRGWETLSRACSLADAVGAPAMVACVAPNVLWEVARRLPPNLLLCVENHWNQDLARPREMVRALRSTWVAACLDTGHAILAGVRPERFAATLGPLLGHVHLKDAFRPPLRHLALGRRARDRLLARPDAAFPGTGALDLALFRRTLERSGFSGVVSLEHEGAAPQDALAVLRARWETAAAG